MKSAQYGTNVYNAASFPHEGTWIEIEASVQIPLYGYVVPHEGTWIEITEHSVSPFRKQPSFPTRERGLKFDQERLKDPQKLSFPTRERGLKYQRKEIRGD